MELGQIFWLFSILAHSIVPISAPLPWVQFSAGPSKRSRGCEGQPDEGPNECVCLGTDNGRNVISVDGLSHYSRLKKSFVRCRQIVGNLEITHIDEDDLEKVDRDTQFGNGTRAVKERERAFQFLEHLEEITGYLLVFNVNLSELALPKLRVIWGEKLHDGNALQIDSNPSLRILNLPSLRTIEAGNLAIKRSPNLCYMSWRKGSSLKHVDYSEILSSGSLELRLELDTFSRKCRTTLPCNQNCDGNCFGPGRDQCQTIYRKNCHHLCESKACFLDAKGTRHCCDEACAGGCFGEGRDQCVACKRFEEDGKCVAQCRGTHSYNPNTLEREELPEEERRLAHGRHCVQKCPPGSLVEDEHCVSRCSIGKYRDAQTDDGRCVPCPEGRCPRVCQLTEPLNAVNIRQLANCSEIEGNIEILGYAFQEHMPQRATPIPGSMPIVIPPLNASQLDVLRSVRIVTGFVALDGSKVSSQLKPKSLGFLENLEVIEGRRLYYEKYALYIIGNPDLKWLGLRSLRRIKNGLISVQRNERLCYGHSIPFQRVLGVRESLWKENMGREKCEQHRRKCDPNCDPQTGCWGPGPTQCVKCRHFSREGECAEECPKQGYFVPESSPNQCQSCHEQCRLCHGPSATDCSKCLNFEMWTDTKNVIVAESVSAKHSQGATLKCVAKCPNGTFEAANQCQPCHAACQDGCTGPSRRVGPNGCNKCRFAVEADGLMSCLLGEEPVNAICGERNGLAEGHYLALEPFSISSKFICRKCRPECFTCTRDGLSSDICQCAFWDLAEWNGQNFKGSECALDCGKGSRILSQSKNSSSGSNLGLCQQCHPLCDPHFSCADNGPTGCERCVHGGIGTENGTILCLDSCPADSPYKDEAGICQSEHPERVKRQKKWTIALSVLTALLFLSALIGFLVYRCLIYQKKYIKEVQMHLPEIPPLDPMKVTQRPNMRRLNLIQINELDFVPGKSAILGQGAFGIVYAGKWRPPDEKRILPVAIKAINQMGSLPVSEKELLREAALMHSVRHEHLLPVAGICLGEGAIKIVTLLRAHGSLLHFFKQYGPQLSSKQLVVYCYQISSAMEYLAKKGIVHRDLAARNVLVRTIEHVEVTDFGLAAMLQRPGDSVVVEGRVAVKWLAPESLRQQIYNEWTDVWSFGVTCWEILTLGESPYKEWALPRECLARELADRLEKGHRLTIPDNCSSEFQQMLLNCWLFNPESRPRFRQIKEELKEFCRAPHLYIRREATQQQQKRMDSTSSSQNQLTITRLLKDNDFLEHADPEDRIGSPNTAITDCFLSTNGSARSRSSPQPGRRVEQGRLGSTGTVSSRYKSDPVGRKWSSQLEEAGRRTSEEENYLVPRKELGKLVDEEEEKEEEQTEEADYTPVVDANAKAGIGEASSIGAEYANQQQKREYVNEDVSQKREVSPKIGGYVNTRVKTETPK